MRRPVFRQHVRQRSRRRTEGHGREVVNCCCGAFDLHGLFVDVVNGQYKWSIKLPLTGVYAKIHLEELWSSADPGGWRPSSTPRSHWPPPPNETNGYLRVRCDGGLNRQRIMISNAVLAARIMNATLVLPELDTNSFWHDDSGFHGIYDDEHFIRTLRDAPVSWYATVALEKMKEHGVIYLTPFSHRLAEEIDNPEYQRLRCRVNYHALRFKPHIMKLSQLIVDKLRAQGHFMSIHLRFEMDMLSLAGYSKVF
ncbi:hypothetical protein L6164_021751 [Bauhinia variegata]|uniref:Uncharacterized protein n=1 Tax=Bauhinia variegata TaxID=167791 RepID=A0ACB9MDD9_BAUVA|nr:hypothetical protein L6164_021751 [Bauhinia variegata]